MTSKVKQPNYPQEVVEAIVAEYEANPTKETIERLSNEFKKSKRSVISKLSSLGVYVAPVKTTKNGEPIVKKEDIVANISQTLGVELPSLVKANKADLNKLVEFVCENVE
jgi:hypothetical protein